MVKLYHYTDATGKGLIEKSGVILASQKSSIRDDAVYGDGVYLTSLGPENSTAEILGNNYDGRVVQLSRKPFTEYYFEFDSEDDDFVKIGDGTNRDIWILKGTKGLALAKGQKAKSRKV